MQKIVLLIFRCSNLQTTIPSKSVLMDAIDCPVPIRHRYRMGMMRRMTQALSIAEKVGGKQALTIKLEIGKNLEFLCMTVETYNIK